VCGRCREERISGTAGRRKRASWWGMQLRRRIPDMAERRGRLVGFSGRTNNSNRAGPRRRGSEAVRCW